MWPLAGCLLLALIVHRATTLTVKELLESCKNSEQDCKDMANTMFRVTTGEVHQTCSSPPAAHVDLACYHIVKVALKHDRGLPMAYMKTCYEEKGIKIKICSKLEDLCLKFTKSESCTDLMEIRRLFCYDWADDFQKECIGISTGKSHIVPIVVPSVVGVIALVGLFLGCVFRRKIFKRCYEKKKNVGKQIDRRRRRWTSETSAIEDIESSASNLSAPQSVQHSPLEPPSEQKEQKTNPTSPDTKW